MAIPDTEYHDGTFNFYKVLLKYSQHQPQNKAIWYVMDTNQETIWTYSDLVQDVQRVSHVLRNAYGITKGTTVMIMVPRSPIWHIVILALFKLGAVIVPGLCDYTANDLEYFLGVAKPRIMVTFDRILTLMEQITNLQDTSCKSLVDIKYLERFTRLQNCTDTTNMDFECASMSLEDISVCFFTSGTSGRQKLTVHTVKSVPWGWGLDINNWHNLTNQDIMWQHTTLGWPKSFASNLLWPLSRGSCIFCHQMPVFYDFERIIKTLASYPITVACYVPAIWSGMIKRHKDLRLLKTSKLRTCLCAGEYLNNDIFYAWKQMTGLDIKAGYGQTELGLVISQQDNVIINPGPIGKPIPGYVFEVLDEQGNVLGINQVGNLALSLTKGSSRQLFSGYHEDPERTSTVMKDSHYLTGDMAKIDEYGYIWYLGRNDDMINRGLRIGPTDIECMLEKHPAVLECAVIGKFSTDKNQEIVKAFVKLKDNVNASYEDICRDLKSFSDSSTSDLFCPQEFEIIPQIPRSSSGKIQRSKLRERERKMTMD